MSVSSGHQTSASGVSNAVSPGVLQFFSDQPYNTSQPKAYLNWILFDEQMHYVQTGSSAQQVSAAASSGKELLSTLQDIAKSGYLYVYVSNESPQDVYLDDVSVEHFTGPLFQEQHYYPGCVPHVVELSNQHKEELQLLYKLKPLLSSNKGKHS